MSTEGLGISHSMPHAGTPPGLPGKRGGFSCWCKWTSGLGYLDSDHTIAQFLVLPYPSTGCPDPSYVPDWLLGWVMKMGNTVHTDTHIYPVGICDMTCRGISEVGT